MAERIMATDGTITCRKNPKSTPRKRNSSNIATTAAVSSNRGRATINPALQPGWITKAPE